MRSQHEYIVTKDEVYGTASYWLASAVKWEYEGRTCTAGTLIQTLLIAAARVVSIYAACRELADAPCDQTIRNALNANLPDIKTLERQLNRGLATELPKALLRKKRALAIDLTLIPYHGQPAHSKNEIFRSSPKSGTTHFHAYATVVVVHKGLNYTLAVTAVTRNEPMKEVVQRLVQIVRQRQVKIKFLLLDKGFFHAAVIAYLNRAKLGFVIPAVPRGRKPKPGRRATGLRALRRKPHGYYQHTLRGKVHGKQRDVTMTICVASRSYRHGKTGQRKRKPLLYAISKVRRNPIAIRELYRRRFGIETSYRQMNQARIRTCTRDPRQRLLFVALALLLRNVWVWFHYRFATNKGSEEPTRYLELLRFKTLLDWIIHVVERLLHADQVLGVKLEDYQRLKKIHR
jgi:hypothetical protein